MPTALDAQLAHERDQRLAAEDRSRALHQRIAQGADEREEAREQAERDADNASVAGAISGERARIGLILRGAGQANSAAALDLALTTDLSPQAVARILGHGAATSSQEAAPEPIPAPLGAAAQAAVNAERGRIGAILRAPEAEDRAAAAQGLALDSNVTLQQARALLSRLPKAVDRMKTLFGPGGYRTIEERSKETGEFGASGDMERPSKGGDAWSKAVSELNKEATAGRSPSRPAEPDFTSETFASDRRT